MAGQAAAAENKRWKNKDRGRTDKMLPNVKREFISLDKAAPIKCSLINDKKKGRKSRGRRKVSSEWAIRNSLSFRSKVKLIEQEFYEMHFLYSFTSFSPDSITKQKQ